MVLGIRPSVHGPPSIREVLIQWADLPPFEASWEPFSTIQQQFPDFPLEDKGKLWAAGNVKAPFHFTYTRRKKQQE